MSSLGPNKPRQGQAADFVGTGRNCHVRQERRHQMILRGVDRRPPFPLLFPSALPGAESTCTLRLTSAPRYLTSVHSEA